MTAHAGVREDTRLVVGSLAVRLLLAGGAYGLLAVAYQQAEPHAGRPSLLEVVVATVLVTVLLWTAQDRIDRLLRRLVLGERAGGHEIMQGLLRRMSTTLPVDEVVPRVAEVASRTTGRPSAEVRLWLGDGERWSQAWPTPAVSGPAGSRHAVGVRYAGADVGEIAVELAGEQLSPVEQRLLDELAGPAGLALSTVRLTVQLRQRKADLERLTAALEASRDRLLTARVDEQRRFRSEVSGSVTTHVSTALAALEDAAATPAAATAPSTGPRAAAADIDPALVQQAGTEAGLALDALRVIARGVYPPRLADQGYASSVDGWLLRAERHARIGLSGDLPGLHADPALESCLYFCTVTVLAALDAGGATDLSVQLDVGPRVELRVAGSGDRPLDEDVSLVVGDRVAAFDGTVVPVPAAAGVGILASVPRQPSPVPGPQSTPPVTP